PAGCAASLGVSTEAGNGVARGGTQGTGEAARVGATLQARLKKTCPKEGAEGLNRPETTSPRSHLPALGRDGKPPNSTGPDGLLASRCARDGLPRRGERRPPAARGSRPLDGAGPRT